MEFVFIIGIARTGSKIYMGSLNRWSDIDIVNEMHYLAPRYIRRDAVHTLNLFQAPLTSRERIASAVEMMYSGELRGTFWDKRDHTEALQQRIVDIDRQSISDKLAVGDGTAETVLRVLLLEHARVAGKKRAGAKFPVDISCALKLRQWFPAAKFVHLIRDPRAIYGSMVMRDANRGHRGKGSRLAAMVRRLPYLILQFRRAARVHERLTGSANYYLSRFEDLAENPAMHMQKLCASLDTEYREEMLILRKVDSSYAGHEVVGVDAGAVAQWRNHLFAAEIAIIETALKAEMRLFGYTDRA